MTSISLLRRFGILFAVLAIVCDCALAGSPMDDFESAKRLAKRENRDILLSFSGYRWWYPTIAFNTQTDDPWIRKHFIMLEVGIPRDSMDSGRAATVEDRALIELRRMFHQEIDEPGPAILLLGADGRPYAQVDSNEQPAEVYLSDLKEAVERRVKRDNAFQRARNADGINKARLLDDGLKALYVIKVEGKVETLDNSQQLLMHDYYDDILADISKNDPKDVLGRGKELRDRKQWEKKKSELSLINEELERLTADLDQMLEDSPPLAEFFARIDRFLDSHPAIPAEARQRALLGKVEAAIILRDYPSAIKALDDVISAFPHDDSIKTLGSRIRPELDKAQKQSEAGTHHAACDYTIRLNWHALELFDADGKRTLNKLKRFDSGAAVLKESQLNNLLSKVHLLLCLGEYQQALTALDTFRDMGKTSEQARRRDRIYRPFILRGLRLAGHSRNHPTEAEQAGSGQPATRPESKPQGSDKPQPESEGRSR